MCLIKIKLIKTIIRSEQHQATLSFTEKESEEALANGFTGALDRNGNRAIGTQKEEKWLANNF